MKTLTRSAGPYGLVPTAVCVMLIAAASNVSAASNTLRAYIFDGSTFDPDVSLSSSTDAVSFDTFSGVIGPPPLLSGFPNAGGVAGFANFALLKAQAYSSNNGASITTQASTDIGTTFSGNVVGASFGDVARFNISLRLDGTLNSGAAAGDQTGSVDVRASLRIL